VPLPDPGRWDRGDSRPVRRIPGGARDTQEARLDPRLPAGPRDLMPPPRDPVSWLGCLASAAGDRRWGECWVGPTQARRDTCRNQCCNRPARRQLDRPQREMYSLASSTTGTTTSVSCWMCGSALAPTVRSNGRRRSQARFEVSAGAAKPCEPSSIRLISALDGLRSRPEPLTPSASDGGKASL
jgi:hypothetical protein